MISTEKLKEILSSACNHLKEECFLKERMLKTKRIAKKYVFLCIILLILQL